MVPPCGIGVWHPQERPLREECLGRLPAGGLRGLGVKPLQQPADDGVELLERRELAVVRAEPLHQLREVLSLPLGVGMHGLAKHRLEEAVLRERREGGVDLSLPELALRAVRHRLHVVEEDFGRRAAEVNYGVQHAPHQRRLGLVESHLYVLGPRESEDHQEDVEPRRRPVPHPQGHVLLPVDLGLPPWRRLEAHRGDAGGLCGGGAAVVPHQPVPARVPQRPDEPVDGHRLAGSLELHVDDIPERVDLRRLLPPRWRRGGLRAVPGLEQADLAVL